jgi:hypothetical protein
MSEQVSMACATPVELHERISEILGGSFQMPAEVRQRGDEVIRGWFYRADGRAYERVSEAVLNSLPASRLVNEALCSRLLYGVDDTRLTKLDRLSCKTRYRLGLSPHWSFRKMRAEKALAWARPAKFFGVDDVSKLVAKICTVFRSEGFRSEVRVHYARETRDYSRGYWGHSVKLEPAATVQ